MDIENYQTLVFDCDGVVLNSNKVKTEAFYKTALPYGESSAQQLVDYHVANGGISRYKKFEWFLHEILQGINGPNLEQLLTNYAAEVRHGLLTCEIASGLFELRKKTTHAKWLIISGGDQKELREIFSVRKLDSLFDGGIFGSPDSKEIILAREISAKNILENALFIGDSKYDYESSTKFGLNFLFLKKWSEFKNYSDFFEKKCVLILDDICAMNGVLNN